MFAAESDGVAHEVPRRAEDKACPRCSGHFECRAGSVVPCMCQSVSLTEEQRRHLCSTYNGCLCLACLQALAAGGDELIERAPMSA